MDCQSFKQLIKQVQIGKQLPDAVYLHRDAMHELPSELQKFIPAVARAVKLPDEQWNLIKLFRNEFRLSLLNYPDFYRESYPALEQSLNVDLSKLSHKVTCYRSSDNPPILHRKETMILPGSDFFDLFTALTEEGERAGLYENSRIIGFRRSWLNLIQKKGYQLVEGRLLKVGSEFSSIIAIEPGIDRYKTAIVRHELSGPMKTLAKQGYLDGHLSIFDYGCGRGDDLRELEAHGLDVLGWDPVYSPDNDKVNSDIVNLGFVLNVIEDQDERLEALLNAWELADKILVVSVMLANESYIEQFQPYKDGVITSRNTFQKYYAQSEFKGYLERSLQDDAIAVGPGIFYVFKDKLEEQRYLQSKYQRSYSWQQLTSPSPIESKGREKLIITQNSELFDDFWNVCLKFGRIPINDEFERSEEVKNLIGSHKKVFSLLKDMYGDHEFAKAEKSHKEDLLVYIAMGLFEKRKPYTQQPDSLKRDIKALFDDFRTVNTLATELLFAIADTQLIEEQCITAHKKLPASILNEGHSLIFHKNHIEILPLLLRIYVGAALQMYGELDDAISLVKIHINSGKLTLTKYDNFENSVPYLVERVKIKMSDQDIDFFYYLDETRRPPLLNKHLLVDSKHELYEKQKSLDKRLSKLLGIVSTGEVNLNRQVFEERLAHAKKQVIGFKLISG
jgi:DNA phosphorothioation-associated putative methyltransferase